MSAIGVGKTLTWLLYTILSIGWGLNFIAVFYGSFDPITGQMVMRIIGIFIPPLGGLMGFLP